MALDLKKLDVGGKSESGYEFEVLHPVTREGTGGYIKVRGTQSPTYKKWLRAKIDENEQAKKRAERTGKAFSRTFAELEVEAAENAAARVISWRGIADDGAEVPCSEETAAKLFRVETWLRDQVVEASNELGNFIEG